MLFGSMTKNGALQIGQFLELGVNGNDCQWDTMATEEEKVLHMNMSHGRGEGRGFIIKRVLCNESYVEKGTQVGISWVEY